MADNGAPNNFEKQVLDYIRKSNAGHQKAGVGPFSITGNQAGNADLAQALLDFKRSDAKDSFKDLNRVGKGILDSIQKMAEEGISNDSVENRHSVEQIKVLRELLVMVEDGTDEQKRSKKELINFIGKTEKGLLKNASFKNKIVEVSRAVLPSAAGIMAGMFSKSPVIAGLVNFGMEKLQDRYDRKQKNKVDNVQRLIGLFDEIAQEEKRRGDSEERRSTKSDLSDRSSGSSEDPVPVRIVEQSSPIQVESKREGGQEEEATLEDFYAGVRDALEAADIDEDLIVEAIRQTKEAIEDITEGDSEKIKEFMARVVDATSTEAEMLERISRGVLQGEESAREDRFQMERQNKILERVADATEANRDAAKKGEEGGLLGLVGGKGSLKDKVLQWLGIGAIGTTAMSKLGAVFGMLSKVSSKVLAIGSRFLPGAGKLLTKIFSFPVQFFIAVGNGLKRGISALWRGEGIGAAAKETLFGFANWFLAGFLDKINEWFSGHRILDPIFRSIEGSVTEVKDFFVGIYDKAKSNLGAVLDFVSSPIDGVKKMAKSVEEYWLGMVQTIQSLVRNPKEFIMARVEQIRDGVKRFFYSMVPSWIPLKFIPEEIREDVKRARYGQSETGSSPSVKDPNFFDNIYEQFFAAAAPSKAGGPTTRGGRRGGSQQEYDGLSAMSDRINGGLAARERSRSSVASKSTAGSDDLIGRLIKREGGFVNDPDDRGGATNMGITQKTLSKYLGRDASVDDVRGLDEATARKIYEQEYLAPFGDVKDKNLKEFLLDFGTHSGVERVKGFYETAKEGSGSEQETFEKLIERRRQLFTNIIKNDPTQKKFEKGWFNRLAEFENKAKESRAAAMYTAGRQATAPSVASAPIISTNKSTVNNVSNTTVSRRVPVNPDPSQRFYSPAGATA